MSDGTFLKIPGIAVIAASPIGDRLANQSIASLDSASFIMEKLNKDLFVSDKLKRLKLDTNESADFWNTALGYGPMESTYQHDYKKPTVIFPTVRVKPPTSTDFWNHSMSYGPMESTYQHDYKTLMPIDYKNPFDTSTGATKRAAPADPENHEKTYETSEKFQELLNGCQTEFEESRTFKRQVLFSSPKELSQKKVSNT